MTKHAVARAADLPPGARLAVDIGGRPIAVFNVDGELFAVLDRCPHQGGKLSDGYLTGRLESTAPGEYDYAPKRDIVRCPWHSWEFDLRTGQSHCDPERMRVRSFPVSVGTLETFPVAEEGDWIVVEA
jgi:nitrite reductase/ring-hydroxylating ferredoxin subunit